MALKNSTEESLLRKEEKKKLKVEMSCSFMHYLEALRTTNVPWTFNTPSHCNVFPLQPQNELTENDNIHSVCLIPNICPLGLTLLNINFLWKTLSFLSSLGLIFFFFLIYLLVFPMNFKNILSTSVSPPNISSPCWGIFHMRQASSWICLFQLANNFHRDGIGRNEILCH